MKFHVPDMTCGHCAGLINKAIASVDEAAKVAFDVATKSVSIDTACSADDITYAIAQAGYSPQLQA